MIEQKAEKDCRWHFAPGVTYSVGPTDAAGQNFTGTWDSLIRESIQNSLDAVLDKNEPVKVKFAFKSMPMKSYENFSALKDHIQACIDTFPDTAKPKYKPMLSYFNESMARKGGKINYLKISDFNTKGMNYDEQNDSSNFAAFVRGLGVHGGDQTSAGRGGSFGLGKSTIYTMSPFRTMFVSTYAINGQHVFEGVASLTTHKMNGERYSHIGYYDNNIGYPITESEDIPNRFLRDEDDLGKTPYGTDIYVMGRGEAEGDLAEIAKNVLLHYWLSIYKGKLEVEITGGDEEYSIDQSNLAEWMDEYFTSHSDNARKTINPRPYYDAVVMCDDSANNVCIKKNLPNIGEVELYLSKNREAKTDRIAFFRLPCMMVMRRSSSQLTLKTGNYGLYGSFVCVNSDGDELLKKLENPAHDLWSEKNWKNPITSYVEPKGLMIMNELRDFLSEEIENFCKKSGQATMKMLGAGKYLYTVQDMVEHENDETDVPDSGIIAGNDVSDEDTGIRVGSASKDISEDVPTGTSTMSGAVTNERGNGGTPNKTGKITVTVTSPKKKGSSDISSDIVIIR